MIKIWNRMRILKHTMMTTLTTVLTKSFKHVGHATSRLRLHQSGMPQKYWPKGNHNCKVNAHYNKPKEEAQYEVTRLNVDF